MEKAGKIVILTAFWLLGSCVSDPVTTALSTEIAVTVQDTFGTPLNAADVYIYDNVDAFNQTISSGTPAGFVSQAQTANGVATLTKLSPSILYYIYAAFKDFTIYPGTYITSDNSEENFTLKNKLTIGSLSSVHIVVKPIEGLITFWTAGTNGAVLPIDLFIGTTQAGTLNTSTSSAPAPFATGALTVRARKGNRTFEGKSASGCLWANVINLGSAQSVTYQLETCSVGTIAFYTGSSNAAKLPITLKLNANDALSSLSTAVSSVPSNCSAANIVNAFRVPGTFTYEAISVSGNCVWTGTFILNANQCLLIPLPTCP